MMSNRKKYKNVQEAMNTWRDYMVSMGFGYKLGIDLYGEKRGLIPNANYYDKAYKGLCRGRAEDKNRRQARHDSLQPALR